MAWSHTLKVQYLVRLPWTVQVGNAADGDVTVRLVELPFLLATGKDLKGAGRDLFEALWTAMDAMLEHSDKIPLPRGAYLPWDRGEEPSATPRELVLEIAVGGEAWSPTASAISQSLELTA